MPRQKQTDPAPAESHIIEQPITSTLELNFMPYAMSVIVSRAIPEIDGFKPAHRKLLYTMYMMGLLTGGRVKSADVVGQTMRLNPHGDAAIYETMVRLTRGNDALLHPFVDSKGNFGKQYSRDMAYAASRYTEVKLDEICREVFRDIDKDVVDMADNYNNRMKEPTLLPTAFPNLLVTPNLGIAVGMASNVCSFNLREVCQTAAAFLKNPNADISKTLLAPDFSTGGELVMNDADMKSIYATGRGSFKLRARWRYDKKNGCVEIYEIPYTTTAEAIIDRVAALVKAGKLRDVNDVRDETDLKGLKITVDLKKAADPATVMQRLFSQTTLSDTFNCNFNFLVGGRPRVMGIAEILKEWSAFRVNCVRRQLRFDMDAKAKKLHVLEGLAAILLDIDRAIRVIRETEAEAQVIPNLMRGFGITEAQAEFIAEIKLRNLNRAHLLERVAERDRLADEIAELRGILDSEEKTKAAIIAQLKDIAKKYGAERRTQIIHETAAEAQAPPPEDLIDDYNVRLFLTAHSYFKKIPLVSLRQSPEQYLKDDDTVAQEMETANRAELLFFSDRACVYKTRAHQLPDGKASGLGEYLPALLGMDEGERAVYMALANDYAGYMLFAFENGKVAKVAFEAYATKTNRKKLVNAYGDKSPLVAAYWVPEDCDLLLTRGADKAMLVNTALIPLNTGKNSNGVQVFTMKRGAALTGARLAAQTDPYAQDTEYYRVDKIPSAGHFRVQTIGLNVSPLPEAIPRRGL